MKTIRHLAGEYSVKYYHLMMGAQEAMFQALEHGNIQNVLKAGKALTKVAIAPTIDTFRPSLQIAFWSELMSGLVETRSPLKALGHVLQAQMEGIADAYDGIGHGVEPSPKKGVGSIHVSYRMRPHDLSLTVANMYFMNDDRAKDFAKSLVESGQTDCAQVLKCTRLDEYQLAVYDVLATFPEKQ